MYILNQLISLILLAISISRLRISLLLSVETYFSLHNIIFAFLLQFHMTNTHLHHILLNVFLANCPNALDSGLGSLWQHHLSFFTSICFLCKKDSCLVIQSFTISLYNFHMTLDWQDTVFDPVSLACGHIFCYTCACLAASVTIVDGLKAAKFKAKCALCRQVINRIDKN